MVVTSISGNTFLKDSIVFIRNLLRDNVTDPLGRAGSGFVFTSYPREDVKYPIITIRDTGIADIRRLGMGSEGTAMKIPIEVRIWGRNELEKDKLSQQVYVFLQKNQFGTGSETTNAGLHDFTMTSMVNVDEPGEEGIKSKVLEFKYLYIND